MSLLIVSSLLRGVSHRVGTPSLTRKAITIRDMRTSQLARVRLSGQFVQCRYVHVDPGTMTDMLITNREVLVGVGTAAATLVSGTWAAYWQFNKKRKEEMNELKSMFRESEQKQTAAIQDVKKDLTASEQRQTAAIQDVKKDLTAAIQDVKKDLTVAIQDVKKDLTALDQKQTAAIQETKKDLIAAIQDVKKDLTALDQKQIAAIQEVKQDLKDVKKDLTIALSEYRMQGQIDRHNEMFARLFHDRERVTQKNAEHSPAGNKVAASSE